MTRNRLAVLVVALMIATSGAFAVQGVAAQTDDEEATDGTDALQVVSLTAPESAAPGSNVSVGATVENPTDETQTEAVEYRLDGEVVERQIVTVPANETAVVEFDVETGVAQPGDYYHGVFAADSGQVEQVTLSESFALVSLDAPANATAGDDLAVEAVVSNPNDFETNQTVTARLDGDVAGEERLALDAGENQSVTFDVATDDLDDGTAVLGVFTRDDGEFRALNVTGAEEPPNVTEEPENATENVTDEPENVTDEPETVTENETDEPANVTENATEGPENVTENVTEEPANVTENETEEPETVTENETEGPENVTEEPDDVTENDTEESVDEPATDTDGDVEDDPVNETDDDAAEPGDDTEDENGEEQPLNDTDDVDQNAGASAASDADDVVQEQSAANDTDGEELDDTDDAALGVTDGNETAANGTDGNETDAADATNASVDFEGQTATTQVTIANVTAPEGGFVAVHTSDLVNEDEPVDSVIGVSEYLEAGTHENVTVELFNVTGAEFEQSELTEHSTLIAVPYQDTNDNQSFDFVATDGDEDAAYTDADGDLVRDRTAVLVESLDDVDAGAAGADESDANETEDDLNGTDDANETDEDPNETADVNETADGDETDGDLNETEDANETGEGLSETDDEAPLNDTDGTEDEPVNDTENETGEAVDDGTDAPVTEEEPDEGPAGPNATVAFEDQTSNGTHVFVENASLEDGGFVVIHDESLLRGNAIGSVVGVSEYLEPGDHENVTVELFNVTGAEYDVDELEGEGTLIAMPHQDTNGNETFDFVATDGAVDDPYAEDGQPVVDDAEVTTSADAEADAEADDADAENETNGAAALAG